MMRRFVALAFVAILVVGSLGCTAMPWSQGQDSLDDQIGAPPSHFKHLEGRQTGVSDRAREIEGRLGYR